MKLYLAGPHAGKDITFQGVRFVSGIAEVRAEDEGLIRYMRRCYQAFPEGSPELEQALEKFGGREIYYGVGNLPEHVSGNATKVKSDGKKSAQKAAVDKSADAESSSGASGSVAEGDGQKNSRMDLPELIRNACLRIDPEDPDKWAANGMPTAAAVYSVFPQKNVSRKLISQHGLSRDDVRKLKAE